MYARLLEKTLREYAKFPSIALFGPRQAGKTTLVKETFPNHLFFSLDHTPTRQFIDEDPEGFLRTHENEYGIILDEFQYAPAFISYIKLAIDNKKRPGYFILTGSQNFLMNEKITESLAGRVGILNLLPLSLQELSDSKILPNDVDYLILNGSYPRLYDENFSPKELYPSYIQSYVERDIRQLINVENLTIFQRFVQLCAGRTGQLLNYEALSSECGVSAVTIKKWLSLLEASYIIFLLPPHLQNFNKRITKTPKLYFFDTGLACSLLRIEKTIDIAHSPFRGALFETLIIADLYKQYCNQGSRPPLYFWRDKGGSFEVDCIIDEGNQLFPVEIKSGQTFSSDFFKGVLQWNELAQNPPEHGFVVYGGSDVQVRSKGNVLGWQAAASLVAKIRSKKG